MRTVVKFVSIVALTMKAAGFLVMRGMARIGISGLASVVVV
jgi:hypothetical protein